MHLEMAPSESALSYLQPTRTYLERLGKSIAFYSDKQSAFRNNRATADGDGLSHLGRALDKLDVDIICANTPSSPTSCVEGLSRLCASELKRVRRDEIGEPATSTAAETPPSAPVEPRPLRP
ncbi:hypothetical protein [uncultured Sphingomonas sp.]|uniref:hypothetical protein n=1 Tax=uncultured Sphingomonas sp. TaxID=158754 RepID=UPI0025F5293F|nr:hypothetical protein [uncultured Sphingomonas sp.]